MFGYMRNLAGAMLVEFLGTALLVAVGCGAAIQVLLFEPDNPLLQLVAAPFGFGIALGVLATTFGPYSGGHFNPAVSLGSGILRTLPWGAVFGYWLAQLLGGVFGSWLLWQFFGTRARTDAHFAATTLGTSVSTTTGIWVEALAGTAFVTIVLLTGDSGHASKGIALGTGVFLAGQQTGGSLNLARTFGPMVMNWNFQDFPVYLIGSFLVAGGVGAIIAMFVQNVAPPGEEA